MIWKLAPHLEPGRLICRLTVCHLDREQELGVSPATWSSDDRCVHTSADNVPRNRAADFASQYPLIRVCTPIRFVPWFLACLRISFFR